MTAAATEGSCFCLPSVSCSESALWWQFSPFRENLESAIDEQAQTLLGADLSIRSRLPFSKEAETFIASLEGEQARETRFRSMAFFVERSRSRLVQVRALEGAFPFYGEFETSPRGSEFRNMDTPLALVEESLLHQYGVKPGQMVKLGELEFKIAGGLVRVSGENEIRGIFAPRVYIDRRHLPGTGLIKRGSMTRYRVYFQFPNGITRSIEERLDEAKKGLFADERMRMDTVERRKRNLGRALNNIYDYLNLIGFIALLLGGLGVAGAVQVYLKEKLNSVAILRCLGRTNARCLCHLPLPDSRRWFRGFSDGSNPGSRRAVFASCRVGPFSTVFGRTLYILEEHNTECRFRLGSYYSFRPYTVAHDPEGASLKGATCLIRASAGIKKGPRLLDSCPDYRGSSAGLLFLSDEQAAFLGSGSRLFLPAAYSC